MLLVNRQKALASSYLDETFTMLRTLGVEHVESRLKHGNALLVAVHLLIVCVSQCLNLLGDSVHECRNYTVQLFLVLLSACTTTSAGCSRLNLVFDHPDVGVDLCQTGLDDTE